MISPRSLESPHLDGCVERGAARGQRRDTRTRVSLDLDPRRPCSQADNPDSRAPVPPQILDGVLLDRLGLHVQIGPGLDAFPVDPTHGLESGRFRLFPPGRDVLSGGFGGSRDVVNVLSHDLVRADGRPPETPVEHVRDEHGDGFREYGGGVGFQGERFDELDEVRVGVRSRTGETECGPGRRLGCTEHDGESFGDV